MTANEGALQSGKHLHRKDPRHTCALELDRLAAVAVGVAALSRLQRTNVKRTESAYPEWGNRVQRQRGIMTDRRTEFGGGRTHKPA